MENKIEVIILIKLPVWYNIINLNIVKSFYPLAYPTFFVTVLSSKKY
jgi:hypothetical protein